MGGRPRNQTQLAAGVKTPRRNRAGGTHCRSHWTPASHNAISPLTPGLAQPPRPKPDSIPLAGGPLPFWRAPANSQGSFCAAARSYKPGAPGSTLRHDFSATHTHTHIQTGEQTRPTRSDRNCCSPDGNQLVAVLFRQRPYSVEHTRSHLNSEVKQPKARSVLGWGTAWEVLRVLLAFCARVCLHWHKRLMPMASKLLIADRLSRETTWRRYCHSPGRVVLCYPRQVLSLDSYPSVRPGRIENKSEGPRGPSEQ